MKRHQKSLPIDPATLGYPRNAKGEYGAWQDGRHFSWFQCEGHKLEGRYSHTEAQFCLVELEGGDWLADGCIWSERYPDRRHALRAAASKVIDRCSMLAKEPVGSPYRMSVVEANTIIAWASEIADIAPTLVADGDVPKKRPDWLDLPLFSQEPG